MRHNLDLFLDVIVGSMFTLIHTTVYTNNNIQLTVVFYNKKTTYNVKVGHDRKKKTIPSEVSYSTQ